MAPSTVLTVQALSISVSLVASGGIAALSLFDIPLLRSQPASRSLPMTRWLFSRGSHIFPQAAAISSAGFFYLAFAALPAGGRQSVLRLLEFGSNSAKVNSYLVSAALAMSIGPVTTFVMLPTNTALIQLNEDKGGARSQKSAELRKDMSRKRPTNDLLSGKGEAGEVTDLSGPQEETQDQTTEAEDEETRRLMYKFSLMNLVRAVLLGGGGLLGLITALAV